MRPTDDKFRVLMKVDALLRTLPESKARTQMLHDFYDQASITEDYQSLRAVVAQYVEVT